MWILRGLSWRTDFLLLTCKILSQRILVYNGKVVFFPLPHCVLPLPPKKAPNYKYVQNKAFMAVLKFDSGQGKLRIHHSMESAKGRWGKAKHRSKYPGKVKGISEAGLLCHLFDQCPWLLQAFRRLIHLEPKQKLIGTLMVITAEEAAKVGVIYMTLAGDLF